MKKIKIGQIGIGHNHGSPKMETVRKFSELYEVVGFAEEDPDWFAERGAHPAYVGLTRMSNAELLEKCDAILVETGVPELTKTAQMCIDAGKHIHMDKPASGTLAEYEKLLGDAKKKNLIVQLGYMYRYNPAVRHTMDLIKEGKLGEIYSINAEMSTFHPVHYKKWLTQFEGGIMYILGCHLIDLSMLILGEPQKVTKFLKHTRLDGVDYPDNTLAILEWEKALARIFVSSVEVNGWGRRQFVVAGSKGTTSILPMEHTLQMTYSDLELAGDKCYEDHHVLLPIADIADDGRYDDMMKDFYDYVMGIKENPYTYDHELALQKVLLEVCKE